MIMLKQFPLLMDQISIGLTVEAKILSIYLLFSAILCDYLSLSKANPPKFKSSTQLMKDDKTLALIQRDRLNILTNCVLYDLEKNSDTVSNVEDKYEVEAKSCSFDQMVQIIDECNSMPIQQKSELDQDLTLKSRSFERTEVVLNATQMKSLWKGIVPGTKWCGVGDQAKNFHDLGSQVDVDRCCRAHDHCPTRMRALRAEYGVINFSLFTRSHCKCDESFFKCLKSTKSPLADAIGNFYFNILQVGCLDNSNNYRTNADCQKSYLSKKCAFRRLYSRPKVKFNRNRLLY
ncbi:uncharacterized protein LOC141854463 [Brevipalpus obovatus]|uniref:uncharacterized protein LOC141854463 n=1 Tax=Brevipalpus obovatus TaxID=246614 RepID=UPI003D9E4F19